MADEARSGTVSGGTVTGGTVSSGTVTGVDMESNGSALAVGHPDVAGAHHRGRPVSWVAVSIIMAAFVVGGFGLVLGPVWWLFWTGLGLSAVGALLALATDIFQDWY